MSKLIEIDLRPSDDTLRQFGWIALGGFGVLGALAWFEWLVFSFGLGDARIPVATTFWGLGLLTTLFSFTFPRANLPIYIGLTLIALPIGFVVSYAIMGVLFYLLITPVGLFLRLRGRDIMNRSFDPEAESYWVKPRSDRPREHYFKQF
ncbi:MAG: hypothetical protein CL917_07875 [Deltaproteobacteria bacterium]|nr:hypothetical protein [Deltaproteobacteria bacterium]